MRFLTALAAVAAVTLPFSVPADAQTKVKLEEVAGGLTHPLAMVSIPDGSGRKAVIEQHGLVRIIDARGRLLPEPFSNIQAKIVQLHPFFDERGLLGIAFHPNYREQRQVLHRLFGAAPARRRSIEAVVVAHQHGRRDDGVEGQSEQGRPNSERIVHQLDWPQFNHNGHWIGFGPDGKLYMSTGDGGYANDWGIGHNVTMGNGQDLKSHARQDAAPRRRQGRDGIPADNPFVGRSDAEAEIWAYGLRNPWRCSFDMGGTRELICGDVQQNSFEEVSVIARGGNLGWRRMEADKCFDYVNPNTHPATCDKSGLTEPIMVYKNCTAQPQGCIGISVTGGYVYRGATGLARQVHLRRLVEVVRRDGRPDLLRHQGRGRQVDAWRSRRSRA